MGAFSYNLEQNLFQTLTDFILLIFVQKILNGITDYTRKKIYTKSLTGQISVFIRLEIKYLACGILSQVK